MKAWRNTAIIMGVMTIPVGLYSARKDHNTKRHNLHKDCGGRAKQNKFCGKCSTDLDDTNTVKGFEVGKQDIILSDQELASIHLTSAKAVEIVEFTQGDRVDPRMPENSYFVAPEDVGKKGFSILLKTMEATGLTAIGRVVFSGNSRETLVRLIPFGDVLLLQTLSWSDELNSASELTDTTVPVSDKELDLGKMLVEAMTGESDLSKFHDRYEEQVRALLETKSMGGVIEVQPERTEDQVAAVDAAEQLLASIAAVQKSKGKVLQAGDTGVPTRLEPELSPKKKTAKAKRSKVAA